MQQVLYKPSNTSMFIWGKDEGLLIIGETLENTIKVKESEVLYYD